MFLIILCLYYSLFQSTSAIGDQCERARIAQELRQSGTVVPVEERFYLQLPMTHEHSTSTPSTGHQGKASDPVNTEKKDRNDEKEVSPAVETVEVHTNDETTTYRDTTEVNESPCHGAAAVNPDLAAEVGHMLHPAYLLMGH